jgi:tripeptide aminopeptidase
MSAEQRATLINRLLDLTVKIQQIPAPTFAEGIRANFVEQQFIEEGLADVIRDDAGNVYARIPGAGQALPLVVSAHLDTVFPAATDLKINRSLDRIAGPGIGDNSLGVGGLFGLAWLLRQEAITLPGDLWLVANVCEEGLGDLRGMRAVVDRFGDQVSAYLILEGMALGQIYDRALEVRRYRISVYTAGGHSWVDFGRPSAIHELATLITQLTALPLAEKPRTSLGAGIIAGGTSVNTIAAEAHIELDIRAEEPQDLRVLASRVEILVKTANRAGVRVEAELIGQRPGGNISPQHPLVCLVKQALQAQGIIANLSTGSTDANIPLSRGLPAVCIGLTNGGGAHTVGEFIHTRPISQGLEQLLTIAKGVMNLSK